MCLSKLGSTQGHKWNRNTVYSIVHNMFSEGAALLLTSLIFIYFSTGLYRVLKVWKSCGSLERPFSGLEKGWKHRCISLESRRNGMELCQSKKCVL